MVVIVVIVVGPGPAWAAPCWSPPVDAAVVDVFRDPTCRWCAGNRGLEYGSRVGDPVHAAASGVVSFAGTVAGTVYVVVRHADGLRVTYGNLSSRRVRAGDAVARGAVVGESGDGFYFGVRDGDRYLDPAPFIGELRGVVRLVPTDASAPAPAPPPRLTCRVASAPRATPRLPPHGRSRRFPSPRS